MGTHFQKTTSKRILSVLLVCVLTFIPSMGHICAASVNKKTYVVGVGCTVKKSVPSAISSVTSRNPNIVTIKKTGKKAFSLTGKKAGTTMVIVRYGSKKLKATVHVGTTKITGYGATKQGITIAPNAYEEVSVRTQNGKKDRIKWTSSQNTVVHLANSVVNVGNSNKRLVKNTLLAQKEGTSVITARSMNTGKQFSFTVIVKKQIESVTFAPMYTTNIVTNTPSVTVTPVSTTDVLQPTVSVSAVVSETSIPVITGTPTIASTMEPVVPENSSSPEVLVTASPTVSITTTAPAIVTLQPTATTPVFEDVETAKVEDAFICAENRVQIDFTERLLEIDVSNFYLSGVTLLDATLTSDKRSVILKTSSFSPYEDYTLTIANVVSSNGERIYTESKNLYYRELRYSLRLEPEDDCSVMKATTGTSITLTAFLYDSQGRLVKDKASVYFSTTKGKLSEHLVPLENGQAQVNLDSLGYKQKETAVIKAFVYTADNKKLINQADTTEIVLDPDKGSFDEINALAYITKVKITSCDRVMLYFNKEICVTDYTKNTEKERFAYEPVKLRIRVSTTDKENKNTIADTDVYLTPYALLPVENNPKAMYAVLDTSLGYYLTDNCYALVEVTDRLASPTQTTLHKAVISDNGIPYVTKVYNDGMADLKMVFSEPIQNGEGKNSAENLENWTLDGTELSSNAFGINGHQAFIHVGDINLETGEDLRNVATIHLGKNHSLEQIFFVAGKHILCIKNIGDWANKTDMNYNHITSISKTIIVQNDQSEPQFTAQVESPEQYYITFNCPVDADILSKSLKLQYYTDGYWETKSNAQLQVTQTDDDGYCYIAELKQDWTKVLDTQQTNKNYYSFYWRLYIPSDKITNIKNGKKNSELKVPLKGNIMMEPDTESPHVVSVRQDGTACVVELNEPVQVAMGNEIITPSQLQNESISSVSVNFISEDNTKTICSVIYAMGDGHDTAFKVRPNEALTPGIWQVVVRGVSDDVGNTAETSFFAEFVVTGDGISSDPEFAMVWAVGVPIGATNPITGRVESNTEDMLYIKYNGNYKCYNGAANACYPLNYVVASATLSRTAQIGSSLENYNSDANLRNDYTDLVAIHLPAGTLSGETVDMQVSNRIQSVQGESLSNAGDKILTLDDGKTYYTWKYQTYTGTASTITKTTELQAVLDNPDYVAYNLPNFTNYSVTDLQHITISHPGVYSFNANQFTNLEIRTKESGRIQISGGTFDNIIIYAPNAEVYMNGVLVTNGSSTSSGKITVQEVLEEHFILNDVNAKELIMNDGTGGSSIRTTGNTKINTITANTAVNMTFRLESRNRLYIVLTKKSAVTYVSNIEHDIYVEEAAARLHFTNQSMSVAPKIYLDEMLCSLDIISNVIPISKQPI